MDIAAFGLMSDHFQKMVIREMLESRCPLIAQAKSASRFCRSNGKDGRYIYLYDDKLNGNCIGKCLPKTMQLFVDAGLWSYSAARFTDHSPDTGYDHWFPIED